MTPPGNASVRAARFGFFHTLEEAMNAPSISFLIQDFLQPEGIKGAGIG